MNRNMKRINKLPLRDPLSVLPVEVFCHLLSSLDPASIAHASATQTSWRDVILLDSTLFDEIDLTRLNNEGIATCLSIIQHLKALISRANERVVKGSFDLSPFRSYLQDRINPDCTHLLPSFREALQPLHSNLKEIYLEIRQPKDYKEGAAVDSFDIIQPLLEQFRNFNQLKKVFILSFLDLELKAGAEGKGEKSFVMAQHDSAIEDESDRSARKILAIIKEINRFTNSANFTEFCSAGTLDYSGPIEETIDSILEELEGSKASLRKLDLFLFGKVLCSESWDLAMGCTNAESICVYLDSTFFEDEEELLVLPDAAPPFNNLRDFNLSSQFCQIPWTSLIKKIGTNLEDLRLNGIIGGPFISWNALGLLLNNIRESLKSLELNWVVREDEPGDLIPYTNQSKDFLDFPRLERLDLHGIPSQSVCFLTDLKASKLRDLSFIYFTEKGRNSEGHQKVIDLLVNLLTSTAETLVGLYISIEGGVSLEELPQDVTLSFSNLKRLSPRYWNTVPTNLFKWLSRLKYPELTDLSVSEEFWSDFKENAPKLGDFKK